MKPLSDYARNALKTLDRDGPMPEFEINNGCVARMMAEGLIERILLPSPYKVDYGASRNHVRITAAGRERIRPTPSTNRTIGPT